MLCLLFVKFEKNKEFKELQTKLCNIYFALD